MAITIIGIYGLSLLLIIIGFLIKSEYRGMILILLGIIGLIFAIIIDNFERGDKLNVLYKQETAIDFEYSHKREMIQNEE